MHDSDKPLRLASYNIRAGLGTDLKRDPGRVLSAIAGLQADIVALQEADHRLGPRPSALPREMISDLTGLVPVPVSGSERSLGWHGIAVLVRPDLDVTGIHRFDLPGLEPRGAVVADIRTGFGPIRIVAVHLGLLRQSRRVQLDSIRARIADLEDMPTVIMGDFNEWSRRKGLGRLARHYAVLSPGPTFPSRLPVVPLDRIAHCAGLKVNLLPPPSGAHPHPSDHLPILADVSFIPSPLEQHQPVAHDHSGRDQAG